MKKVDTHGLTINNLSSVSSATINNPRGYSQISYDTETGNLLESWHVGHPSESWTSFSSESVIHVINTRRHMSMQALADAVAAAVNA